MTISIDNIKLAVIGLGYVGLPFRPGLTGGHCICVDPYYLTHKAESTGYYPQMILAGRRVNDDMGRYVASQLINPCSLKFNRRLPDKTMWGLILPTRGPIQLSTTL